MWSTKSETWIIVVTTCRAARVNNPGYHRTSTCKLPKLPASIRLNGLTLANAFKTMTPSFPCGCVPYLLAIRTRTPPFARRTLTTVSTTRTSAGFTSLVSIIKNPVIEVTSGSSAQRNSSYVTTTSLKLSTLTKRSFAFAFCNHREGSAVCVTFDTAIMVC